MVETVDFYGITIHLWEILALPFYLLFIYLVANTIKLKRIEQNPFYKYYVRGLFTKISGDWVLLSFTYIYIRAETQLPISNHLYPCGI